MSQFVKPRAKASAYLMFIGEILVALSYIFVFNVFVPFFIFFSFLGVIGAVMFIVGISNLRDLNKRFSTAYVLAFVQLFFSLACAITSIVFNRTGIDAVYAYIGLISRLLEIVYVVLNFAFVLFTILGFREVYSNGKKSTYGRLDIIAYGVLALAYIVINIVCIVIAYKGDENTFRILISASFAPIVLADVWFVIFLYRAFSHLEEDELFEEVDEEELDRSKPYQPKEDIRPEEITEQVEDKPEDKK